MRSVEAAYERRRDTVRRSYGAERYAALERTAREVAADLPPGVLRRFCIQHLREAARQEKRWGVAEDQLLVDAVRARLLAAGRAAAA